MINLTDLESMALHKRTQTGEGYMDSENKYEQHFNLLGHKAKDKVTGYNGVVTSLSFDLYGCVQAVLTPLVDKDKDLESGRWFDVTRLKVTGKKPVMPVPDFSKGYISEGKKGAAEKPLP